MTEGIEQIIDMVWRWDQKKYFWTASDGIVKGQSQDFWLEILDQWLCSSLTFTNVMRSVKG